MLCCFCRTIMCISHKYVYIYPLPLESPAPPHPLGCQGTKLGSLCCIAVSHWLSLSHMVVYICQCYSLNWSHPLFLRLCPQDCPLCLCLYSCPANRFISTQEALKRPVNLLVSVFPYVLNGTHNCDDVRVLADELFKVRWSIICHTILSWRCPSIIHCWMHLSYIIRVCSPSQISEYYTQFLIGGNELHAVGYF